MRVAVSHNKGQQEARRLVDEAVERILRPDVPGPVKLSQIQKNWSGSTLDFSLNARMAFVSAPLQGKITVTEREIIIDCDLPELLTRLVPESAIRAGVESRVRGLLNG